jgi:hypothetical protein
MLRLYAMYQKSRVILVLFIFVALGEIAGLAAVVSTIGPGE